MVIRIGSRASRLAVIQSEILMRQIEKAFPDIRTELVTMKTTGDRILDKTLDKIGGKGLFVKELDEALLSGEVDLTVHSLKDLPMETAAGLPLAAFTAREDPADVLVLPQGQTEIDMRLPVGTSSLRRALQIKELVPGIETAPVRGNVGTRLRKLDEGRFSALILAAAGLKRLGLEKRISRSFGPDEMIPAACQGILAVQSRSGENSVRDREIRRIAEAVNDKNSMLSALAERAYIREIGADCGSPDTAFSRIDGDRMTIIALRYDAGNNRILKDSISGDADDAAKLGKELAAKLMGK